MVLSSLLVGPVAGLLAAVAGLLAGLPLWTAALTYPAAATLATLLALALRLAVQAHPRAPR